ncbi:hypothetical protein AYO40_02650 [Planctomycetaceae bacterium SCGC AG-212-D15]|nr:hypothetical protein AYO40_02650 [Planctomycetaceae bacterium SCGC AG-212-D15]
MKLRNPTLIRIIARLGAWLIRLWMSTLRYRFHWMGPIVDPRSPELAERYLYAFWHECMLAPAYNFGQPDISILISQHADGELIAAISRHLGFNVVRGSTTRGGAEAVRQMVRVGRDAHLAITPDGPRGPRRTVQAGVVYLAARTGLPIIPFGVGFRRAWRAGSWDRFAVPRPWTLATFVVGAPIRVPPDADRDLLERYRCEIEQTMLHFTELAERWAETGEKPQEPPMAKSA